MREEDEDALFFFEPLVLGSYEAVLPGRTTDFAPGGPGADPATGLGDGRNVFAYHSYCPPGPDGWGGGRRSRGRRGLSGHTRINTRGVSPFRHLFAAAVTQNSHTRPLS